MKKLILASSMLLAFTAFVAAQTTPQQSTQKKSSKVTTTHKSKMGKSDTAHPGISKDSTHVTHSKTHKKTN